MAEDAVARDVYGELFAMRGYAVVMAGTAREGLSLARRRRVTVAVVAVTSGATELRKQLLSVRPQLRVHVTGLIPMLGDLRPALARQQLH